MNFYIKKHDYYKLINKNNSFNESLKNRMDFLLDKYPNIELTQFYKKLLNIIQTDNIQIYIKKNNRYKIRKMETFIKKEYGSFKKLLEFNNLKLIKMECVVSDNNSPHLP